MTALTAVSLSAQASNPEMTFIALTRRQIIKTLLVLGAGGVFLLGPSAGADTPLKTVWNKDNHDPTFENFCALCAFITLHDDMAVDALRSIYKVMTDEPWGSSHITRLHTKITSALTSVGSSGLRPSLKNTFWKFDEGEKWFAGHLLTVCYTGIYVNAERPTQRIIYQDALMFSPTAGILPRPFTDPTGYGAWATTPETGK